MPGYSYVAPLGQGARSRIVQVIELKTGRMYALKRVFRKDAHDERFIEQAENEYAVSSRVCHQALRRSFHIRRIRKWLRIQELQILMEHVEAQTLEELRPTDLSVIINLFHQVAEGLHALHQAGYVHADIKPNNLLVTPDQRVKIIDFGQSCPLGFVKSRIQGTPDYIAPEQVRRLAIDQRTDVYNLGATLYWVLTGVAYPTILPSRKRQNGIDLVVSREAKPPHELKPEIPLALSKLVMECCMDNPSGRPADMRQVQSRLLVAQHMIARNSAPATAGLPVPGLVAGSGNYQPACGGPADTDA